MAKRPKGLSLSLKNGKAFIEDLRAMGKAVSGDNVLRALRAGEEQAIGYTKINIRDKGLIKIGNLLNSVQEDRVQVSKPTKAYVLYGPHVIYAAIHEFGGIIRATTSEGLVFKIEGQWIRKQAVKIPARPYTRPVLDEHSAEISDIFFANLMEEVGAIFSG
jgi:phage gpG-like protein